MQNRHQSTNKHQQGTFFFAYPARDSLDIDLCKWNLQIDTESQSILNLLKYAWMLLWHRRDMTQLNNTNRTQQKKKNTKTNNLRSQAHALTNHKIVATNI